MIGVPGSSRGWAATRCPVGSLPDPGRNSSWFCWLIAEGTGMGMGGWHPIPVMLASSGGGWGSAWPAASPEWHLWGSGDGGSITLGMGEHHFGDWEALRGGGGRQDRGTDGRTHCPGDGAASLQRDALPQGWVIIALGTLSPTRADGQP